MKGNLLRQHFVLLACFVRLCWIFLQPCRAPTSISRQRSRENGDGTAPPFIQKQWRPLDGKDASAVSFHLLVSNDINKNIGCAVKTTKHAPLSSSCEYFSNHSRRGKANASDDAMAVPFLTVKYHESGASADRSTQTPLLHPCKE